MSNDARLPKKGGVARARERMRKLLDQKPSEELICIINDNTITLSVLLLRKHSGLFKNHENDPTKRFLAKMLYDSTRRQLTEKEAEKAIAGIKELRGKQ